MRTLLLFTLLSCGILRVSLQAIDASATLQFGAPFPTSVEIFVSSKCALVTKWTIQYRSTENVSFIQSIDTEPTMIYAARVSGLFPNTAYEFRLRAAQLYGTTATTEIEYPFPDWSSSFIVFTDSLSIFGRVKLTDFAFTSGYGAKGSTGWNNCLKKVQGAYRAQFSIQENRVSLLRIDRSNTNNPVVFYRVKVYDIALPSPIDYAIFGRGLSDCAVNNGDTASGSPMIKTTSNVGYTRYTLWYENSRCRNVFHGRIVERYMEVSGGNSPMSIHLNVASSDATLSYEEDSSLVVKQNGDLMLDNGRVYATLPRGIRVGLTPRFLVKDCLRGSLDVVTYSEIFGATVYREVTVVEVEHLWDRTEYTTPYVNATTMSCSSGYGGTSVICDIPAITGGFKYEVLNGTSGNTLGAVSETELRCSSTIQVAIRDLTLNSTYELGLRVWVRNSDGTKQSATSSVTLYMTTTTTTDIAHFENTTADKVTDHMTSTVVTSTETVLSNIPRPKPGDVECLFPIFGCSLSYSTKLLIVISLSVGCSAVFIGIIGTLCIFKAARKRKGTNELSQVRY